MRLAASAVSERFDAYLQRAFADGYEAMASTPFGAEIMEARQEFAEGIAQAASGRARKGLQKFVRVQTSANPRARADALDLLTMAPTGLKSDRPSVRVFRRRLTALAHAAAALLQAR